MYEIVKEIRAIMPAEGWYAHYTDKKEEQDSDYYEPLVLWGAVILEEEGELYPAIVGFILADGILDRADDVQNFVGYSRVEGPGTFTERVN